jgi:putative membrane protein
MDPRTHSTIRRSLLISLGLTLAMGTARATDDPKAKGSASQFMKDAAADGLAEVELGKMAADKATRPEVKKFAEMMVEDHGKANEELKNLADRKSVSLPSEPKPEMKAEKEKLSKMSGPAFDDGYVRCMLKDHEKAVALFSKEASSGSDPDTKAWAAKTLPALKEHLAKVKELASGRAMSRHQH